VFGIVADALGMPSQGGGHALDGGKAAFIGKFAPSLKIGAHLLEGYRVIPESSYLFA